ncbi:TonB-dependent receptor [Brevundimonas aurifodinae]|uniref:TonB-dependent receptor n=1 Tax=Brevundimonas aurifodinae TaxID=1508312 RepID=A0ABV1NND2_9CAUL
MKRLSFGVFFAALMSSTAMAQTMPPQTTGQDEASQLDEIVVTAQRREENVQKIPVAVAVVDGQTLARRSSTDISDLQALVPSVSFAAGNELRNNSIRVRGVGTDVFTTGIEPSVSTVVDGVVLQRPGSAFSDLGDIQRIEVLRGPQGTLFGKNSSAGVVNVITQAPSFSGPTGNIGGLIAQDNEYRINGAYSAPISDTLAFRLAAFYRTQDGIVTNLYTNDTVNDQEAYGARLKLAWNPSDNLRIQFAADYSELNSSAGALPLRVATNNPKALNTGTPVGPNNDQVNNDVVPFVDQENYGASLTIDYDIGDFTLTSITAVRDFSNTSDVDLDDTQAQIVLSNFNIESSETTTQEFRLTSPASDVFDFVIGAYFFDGSVYNYLNRPGLNLASTAITSINPDGTLNRTSPYGLLTGDSTVESRNASIFGQANWHLGDRLTLTGGLRYLEEDQTLKFSRPVSAFFNGDTQPATNPAFTPPDLDFHDSALIGKAAITFEATENVTAYASYSTGYKSEGITSSLGLTQAQYDVQPAPAETSELIEAGLKTRLFDRRLTLNVTAFQTTFSDYQAQVYNAAVGLNFITSAGTVEIPGFEIEFQARPFEGFTLNGGVTKLDATFQDIPNGPCYSGQTAAQGCVPTQLGTAIVSVQNLNDKPFIVAPDIRYTLSGRYERLLFGDVEGFVQMDYRWQDDIIFEISQNPNMRQDAYGVADVSAGVSFADGRYDLTAFVKNVFDEQYVSNIVPNGASGGANSYVQNLPRDFHRYGGVTFRARF